MKTFIQILTACLIAIQVIARVNTNQISTKDTWTNKTVLPGIARQVAPILYVDDKGYMGLGESFFQHYCYGVFANEKLFIHQPGMPGLPGNEGFKTTQDASKVAMLVIDKKT